MKKRDPEAGGVFSVEFLIILTSSVVGALLVVLVYSTVLVDRSNDFNDRISPVTTTTT